jgi:hypothetical protein
VKIENWRSDGTNQRVVVKPGVVDRGNVVLRLSTKPPGYATRRNVSVGITPAVARELAAALAEMADDVEKRALRSAED